MIGTPLLTTDETQRNREYVLDRWSTSTSTAIDIAAGLPVPYPGNKNAQSAYVLYLVTSARRKADPRAIRRHAPRSKTATAKIQNAPQDAPEPAPLSIQIPEIEVSPVSQHNRPFGYRIMGKMLLGKPISIARFTCKCGQVHDQTLNGMTPPEKIAKRAARDGWLVDAFAESVTRCPTCREGRVPEQVEQPTPLRPVLDGTGPRVLTTAADLAKAKLLPDDIAPRAAPLPPEPKPPAPPTQLHLVPAVNTTLVTPMPLMTPMPLVTPVPLPAVAVAAPTTQQRLAVRGLLDHHFDDQEGLYLDGYSDAQVAAEAGVDELFVTRARELTYGPLRQAPGDLAAELQETRARLALVENSLAELRGQVSRMLAAQVDQTAARYGLGVTVPKRPNGSSFGQA